MSKEDSKGITIINILKINMLLPFSHISFPFIYLFEGDGLGLGQMILVVLVPSMLCTI